MQKLGITILTGVITYLSMIVAQKKGDNEQK